MEQDQQQLPEATNTAMDTFEEKKNMWDVSSEERHEDVWDTQFLEAINAAMDVVEEQEGMRNQPLPSLEALESAMEVQRYAYQYIGMFQLKTYIYDKETILNIVI